MVMLSYFYFLMFSFFKMSIDKSLKGNIMKLCYGDVLRTYKCSGLPCFLKPDASLCLAVFQVFHPYMIGQFGNVSGGQPLN